MFKLSIVLIFLVHMGCGIKGPPLPPVIMLPITSYPEASPAPETQTHPK